MTRLWIVRAGKQGDCELAAIEQDRLLPGFLDVGDLQRFPDRDAILGHLTQVMPDGGRNRLRNSAAQLNQFAHAIQIDDLVVMPRKLTDGVAIGEVTGDYIFDAEDPYKRSRPVNWSQESVPRDTFKQDLRHSLGAFMTICEIKRNAALDRVRAVLETGADPGPLLGEQGLTPAQTPDEGADAEDYAVDIEDIANQQIVSLIKSKFAGHALADLVAEILRVEGYTTSVSEPGPDQGVDILAAAARSGWARTASAFRSSPATAPPTTTWCAADRLGLEYAGPDRPSGQHRRRERGRPEGAGQTTSSSCACGKCRTCSRRSFAPTKTFLTAPAPSCP